MKNNIFKMTILSLILAGLTACGSSGGGGSKSVPTDPTVQNPFEPVENPSIDSVPEKYQQEVRELKKTTLPDDFFEDDDGNIRTLKLNGFEIQQGQELNLADYANGLTSFSLTGADGESEIKIYQQPYSVVFGEYWIHDENWVQDDGLNPGTTMIFNILGLLTEENALPTGITANYTGQAFLNDELGKLRYDVDFVGRRGRGQITGINHTGTVTLHEANITSPRDMFIDGNKISNATGIDGKATMAKHGGVDYKYRLNFYGPEAEEIAGYVIGDDATKGEIGFAGQRQVTP